jgi:hypothetical protein
MLTANGATASTNPYKIEVSVVSSVTATYCSIFVFNAWSSFTDNVPVPVAEEAIVGVVHDVMAASI